MKTRKFFGLTIIEVVVAISLLFLASSFVLSMFITGAQGSRQSDELTRLNSLTQSKMDEVASTRFDLLPTTTGSGTFASPNQQYSYTVSAQPLETSGSGVVTSYRMTVSVTSPSGRTRDWNTVRSDDPRELGERLYFSFGCVGCHTLDKVGANGRIGPNHSHLGDYAKERVPGLSAEQYIKQSVRDPQAYVVPGYTPFMEGLPLTTMSDSDLSSLSDWLIKMTTTPPPPPPPDPPPPGPPGPGGTPTPDPTPVAPPGWCSVPPVLPLCPAPGMY